MGNDISNNTMKSDKKVGVLGWVLCLLLAEVVSLGIISLDVWLIAWLDIPAEKFPFPPIFISWVPNLLLGPGTMYWLIYIRSKQVSLTKAGIMACANIMFFAIMYIGIVFNFFIIIFLYDFFARDMLMWGS